MSARAVAWGIWTAAQALVVGALALLALSLDAPVPDSWGFRSFTVIPAVVFSATGIVIVAARRSLVGWLLLLAGLASAVQEFASEYAIYGVLARPGSLPAADVAAWVETWIWPVFLALGAIYVPLVFPDGRLPSPRWRVLAVASTLVVLALGFGLAFSEGPLNNAPFVENPFGVLPIIDTVKLEASAYFYAVYVAFFGCVVAAVASVVGRYRRSHGVERQQIKWLAYGAGVLAVAVIAGGLLQQYKASQYFLIAAMHVVPLSVAIAILRYRLYDIDVLINRTLVYGAVSTLLAATYFAAVLLFQTALRPFTSGSEIAVAGSTLVVVALFQPVRRRVQDAVDRRFYRSRYDAARTLEAFGARLRNEVDLDAIRDDVLGVVRETVRPTRAGIWLREVRR